MNYQRAPKLVLTLGLSVFVFFQPLPATEYSPPDEQGIHEDQVTLISQIVDDKTIYRACLLAEAEFNCYQLKTSEVEACYFKDKTLACTTPTKSNTLDILDDVIDGAE